MINLLSPIHPRRGSLGLTGLRLPWGKGGHTSGIAARFVGRGRWGVHSQNRSCTSHLRPSSAPSPTPPSPLAGGPRRYQHSTSQAPSRLSGGCRPHNGTNRQPSTSPPFPTLPSGIHTLPLAPFILPPSRATSRTPPRPLVLVQAGRVPPKGHATTRQPLDRAAWSPFVGRWS
jgi:hypothetical protein